MRCILQHALHPPPNSHPQPGMRLLALLTCLASLRLGVALVRPSELFMPPAAQGQQIALLPDAAFKGVVVQALEGVTSAETCAAQCRAALPDCSFFTFCKSVSGNAAASMGCMWPFAGPPPPDPPPGHARFHAHVCAVLVCAGHLQHPGL